jgi:hypothetical protein
MSKQTAVEWLVEEYAKAFKIPVNAVMQETIQQALAMEKEQIVDAWSDGAYGSGEFMTNWDDAEQYYNEIYKGGPNE